MSVLGKFEEDGRRQKQVQATIEFMKGKSAQGLFCTRNIFKICLINPLGFLCSEKKWHNVSWCSKIDIIRLVVK